MATRKRSSPLERQLKSRGRQEVVDVGADDGFDIIDAATNIEQSMATHRHEIDSASKACVAACQDLEELDGTTATSEKLAQYKHMFDGLAKQYETLLRYTVNLEAATKLAITSHYQHAMQVAMGDPESASDGRDASHSTALMSSVHRP